MKAIESFVKASGKPPINLKFIVEGEEEIGSDNLDDLMSEHAADWRWIVEALLRRIPAPA